jgi:polysaccharide pyruvyl transferase WcaK-like protein
MKIKNNRRILLIGDLRPVFNYGAVATSDVLLKRIRQRMLPGDELRVIDHRSFFRITPVGGFPEWTYPQFPKDPAKLRRMILRSQIKNFTRKALQTPAQRQAQSFDPLPARWKDYPSFKDKVLNGNLYPYEKDLIEWADEVIINSEGNIVNGIEATGKYRRGARYVFAMAYLAQIVFKKPTSIINFTVDPKNPDAEEIIREIFPHIGRIVPREPLSLPELKRIGIDCKFGWCPDILFSYSNEETPDSELTPVSTAIPIPESNYVCLGDSSGLQSLSSVAKWNVKDVYAQMINRIRQDLGKEVVLVDGFNGSNPQINQTAKQLQVPVVSLMNCSYQMLIEILGKADLFISGRWHASIMASLRGTPFILWGSDSHKTRALHVMFDSPYRFYHVDSLPIHLDDLMEDAKGILVAGPTLRESIKNRAHNLGQESLRMLDFISAKP